MHTTTTPPTVQDSLRRGWAAMKKQFLPLFLVTIILGILEGILGIISQDAGWRGSWLILDLIGLAYWLLFLPVIQYSADLLFVQAVRDIKINVKDIINGVNNFLNVVLANLLVIALIGIALVAFIIPGIIVACRLVFVSYLVMDQHLDAIAAVETSWKMTRGYGWEVFALGVLSILIFVAGLLLMGVGVVPASMWISTSFAALYQSVLVQTSEGIFVKGESVS